jgi:TRAP-type C4-dicarboxylate transport system permease small subunit
VLTVIHGIACILLVCSVAINFANIIGRYFFSVSISWAEEIMLFLMVGCVFFGSCAVAWQGRQIKMDVVVGMLPPKIRELLELLSQLTFLAAAVCVAYFAWPVIQQLAEFDERSQAANFPLVIPQALVPIGFTLMGVLVVLRLITHRHTRARRPGESHS